MDQVARLLVDAGNSSGCRNPDAVSEAVDHPAPQAGARGDRIGESRRFAGQGALDPERCFVIRRIGREFSGVCVHGAALIGWA